MTAAKAPRDPADIDRIAETTALLGIVVNLFAASAGTAGSMVHNETLTAIGALDYLVIFIGMAIAGTIHDEGAESPYPSRIYLLSQIGLLVTFGAWWIAYACQH